MTTTPCGATTTGPDGSVLRCERRADHDLPSRRVTHDFSGRAGHCRVCTVTRRRAAEFDCLPYPPTPHLATITWR